MLERRWKPAFTPSSIVEARSAIAQIARPASVSKRGAARECLRDACAAMLDFDQAKNVRLCCTLSDKRHPCRFGARIDFERNGLYSTIYAIRESNGKGTHTMNARSPARKEKPSTLFAARHEWLLALTENVDHNLLRL